MAPVLELDRQTASFVRQLQEQRKLEKTLLVERVRGTKEGLESVFSDIKSRVAVLEKLNGSASATCIAPIGWSKLIFTGADSVSAPNTIGFGDRDETLCKLDQIKYLEDTHYLRLAENPHYVEHVLPNKSLQARVGRILRFGIRSGMSTRATRPCCRFPLRWNRQRYRSCRG